MLNRGVLMTVIRASIPWLCPILFTYTTIITTYPVVCLQIKFGKGPSPLIVSYIILVHGDTLHISWNQYCRMGITYLSGFQGLGDLNIWVPLLCMPSQWAWTGNYKLETSTLNFICSLMTILRLFMQ